MGSRVFYLFNDGDRDVSNHVNTRWYTSFVDAASINKAGSSSKYIQVNSEGLIQFKKENLDDLRKTLTSIGGELVNELSFVALSVYDEKQHQVFRVFSFKIHFLEGDPKLVGVEIKELNNGYSVGQIQNQFQLLAQSEFSSGETKEIDVTGAAKWLSSNSQEFTPSGTPGVFSSVNSGYGKTYKITAEYKGHSKSLDVNIEDEEVLEFKIFNSLGNIDSVVLGQKIPLYANLKLTSRVMQPRSKWYLNGKIIESDKSHIDIDTSKLNQGNLSGINLGFGTHTLEAKTTINLSSKSKTYTATLPIKIDPKFDRLEISLKDPIARAGGEILLNARAYYTGNSYEIVTEDVVWSVSDLSAISIQKNGKATLSENAGGKKLTIRAAYKGKQDSTIITILDGSVVTGSESNLVDISAEDFQGECGVPKRATKLIGTYGDGSTRDITDSASWSFEVVNDSTINSLSDAANFWRDRVINL